MKALGLLKPISGSFLGHCVLGCFVLGFVEVGTHFGDFWLNKYSALSPSVRVTQGNSVELRQGRLRLGVRGRFCTQRWSGTGTGSLGMWAWH